MKDLKIVELKSENVKKLKAVNIKPDGNTVIISGKNGAGKSSVLDSIEYALAGGSSLPDKPIREGQDRAEINLDLGDIQVKRVFKDGKSALKITSKDGATFPSPQAMLDKLVGNLSFDPMNFLGVPDKEQRKILLELIGVDTTELDAKRQELYNERTDAGRSVTTYEGKLNGEEVIASLNTEEISVKELTDKILHENQKKSTKEGYDDRIAHGKTIIQGNVESIEAWKKDVAKAEEDLAKYKEAVIKLEEEQKAIIVGDIEALEEELSGAEELNTQIRHNNKLIDLHADLSCEKALVESLSDEIKDIDKKKEDAIAEAEMPIKDLSFSDDCVTYKDIPLKQVNSADQFKVCLAMGMALNPDLKVILFKNGSLLDKDSLAYVSALAEKHDYQIWIERVDESGEVGVVIEDGSVKE